MAQQRRRPSTPRRASFQLENAPQAQSDSRTAAIVANLAAWMGHCAEVDRAVKCHIAQELRDIARHFAGLADEVTRAPAMEDIPHERLRIVPAVERLIYSWKRCR
jgi:hypothetical protein